MGINKTITNFLITTLNNNMKIIKITLISLLLITSVGCMNHKNDEPIEFTVYETRVTMDKDGNITYYKVKPNEE
jgi:hypothetical protein